MSANPDDAMQACIKDAYHVFARPKPTDPEVCTCCVGPEIRDNFFKYDISALPLSFLNGWFEGATDHPQVSLALSRYLLPRVLEFLALDEDVSYVGPEVSLKRFATGDATRWTDRENEVIKRFVSLYIDKLRPSYAGCPVELPLDDALCMFSAAGHAAQDITEQIWAWSDGDLFSRLAQDWKYRSSGAQIWSTAFWNGGDWALPIHVDNAKFVAGWYRSPALIARATQAFEAAPEGSRAQKYAYSVLTAISAT